MVLHWYVQFNAFNKQEHALEQRMQLLQTSNEKAQEQYLVSVSQQSPDTPAASAVAAEPVPGHPPAQTWPCTAQNSYVQSCRQEDKR